FRTEAFQSGLAYHQSGDFAAAGRSFEQVSYTEVDDILFHFRLGDDFFKRGLYDEAISEYQNALSLNPSYADIHNHLGISFSAKGMVNGAIAEFRNALAINPRFVDAMLNVAITLRDDGQ